MREEFIGTVVKVISGWDNLVAVEVNIDQRRIVTSCQLPTGLACRLGHFASIFTMPGFSSFSIHGINS